MGYSPYAKSQPKIAIIGAGPGGLTLARLLHVSGIPFTVFETDSSRDARRVAGGTLDLDEQTGQRAIRDAGLWTEYMDCVCYDAEDLVIADRQNQVFFRSCGVARGRPEIDRPVLRDMLLDSIPEEFIRWGCHLVSVDGDGTLRFKHGVEPGFELVVGADGAWSKVRRAVCTVQPFYSGVTGLEIRVSKDSLAEVQDVDDMLGRGSYFLYGDDDRALMAQRQGDGSVRVYAYLRRPENWLAGCGVDHSDREGILALLLKEYEGWCPEMKRLIAVCDGPVIPRLLVMLPVGIRWPHHQCLTVLGDAAHVMTPFAGEGVNTAMFDALELARAIKGNLLDVAAAIKQYESRLFPRAAKVQQATWEELLCAFEKDAGRRLANRIQYVMEMRKKDLPVTEGVGADNSV